MGGLSKERIAREKDAQDSQQGFLYHRSMFHFLLEGPRMDGSRYPPVTSGIGSRVIVRKIAIAMI
jgi:hypothetical protein